jgi:hypothetical protein
MKFKPKQVTVDAVKLVDDIFTGHDDPYRNQSKHYIARKGEWLVVDNGEQFFMSDQEFRERYQVV